MGKPFFSVVMLFWKSEQFLPRSLDALEQQRFKDFEVILLDNGAETPPDPTLLEKHRQLSLRVLRSETNLGFAGGNNLASREAQGDYLVLLNGDAFPTPDWLERLHQAALEHPGHCFASRLLQAERPDLLDGEWNVYHISGLAWRKNHNRKPQSAHNKGYVISACAAASAYPRVAFEQVGGFDEDFFAYMEDIDLDLRLQLAGYPFVYLPKAVVHHVGSGSSGVRSEFATYHGQRNLIWTFVKDMPGLLFYLFLPLHVFYNLLYLLVSFAMPAGKALRQGKRDALRQLPKMWQKRKTIQSNRQISVLHFSKLLDWNPLAPLLKLRH